MKKFLDNKLFVGITVLYVVCIVLALTGSTLIDFRILSLVIQLGGLVVAYLVYITWIKK